MTQVTVEEPRSVIEEVKKYECDNCSHIVGKENVHCVEMWPANRFPKPRRVSELRTAHLCDTCIEADSYTTYMNLVEKRESRMSLLADGLNKSLYVVPTAVAISLSAGAALFPSAAVLNPMGKALALLIMLVPAIFFLVFSILLFISRKTSLIHE